MTAKTKIPLVVSIESDDSKNKNATCRHFGLDPEFMLLCD
jgi:hypothetical protein